MELSHRLAQHNSPRFRSRYPSLHYHVMELENMESAFAVLASSLPAESKYQSSLINSIDMLGCLIFQTLDARDLRKYLPKEVEVPLTNFGLNIALPSWQSSPKNRPTNIWDGHESIPSRRSSNSDFEGFPEFSIHEAHIEDYHRSLRERFINLRSSPNPSHRAYYYDVKRKQTLAVSAVRKAKTLQETLLGASREVKSYRCQTRPEEFTTRHCILVGSFFLWLPRSFPVLSNDKIYFKVELSQGISTKAHMHTTPDHRPSHKIGYLYYWDG